MPVDEDRNRMKVLCHHQQQTFNGPEVCLLAALSPSADRQSFEAEITAKPLRFGNRTEASSIIYMSFTKGRGFFSLFFKAIS